jgi:cysteine-rich repeat protein
VLLTASRLAVQLLILGLLASCGDSSDHTPSAICGNGVREYGEECDDGNTVDDLTCTWDCKRPNAICGNGIKEGLEECDDHNLINGDGCDFTCFLERPDADAGPDLPDIIDSADFDLPLDRLDADAIDTPIDITGDDVAQDLCVADVCPMIDCDLWAQTGCDFAEKCTLSGIDRVCVAAGTYTEGQNCVSETECGVGLTCLTNGGLERLCYRFCRDDFDCFGTGSLCVYDLMYGSTPVPWVRLCSKACDPISNIGCPEGFSCMIYQEPGGLNRFLTDCDPHAGEGMDRDACESDAECAPGFFCMPGAGTCVRYCRYPTGYCVVGTCHAFNPHVMLGTIEYGYCTE